MSDLLTDWMSYHYLFGYDSAYRRVGEMIEIQLSKTKSTQFRGNPSEDPEDYLTSGFTLNEDHMPDLEAFTSHDRDSERGSIVLWYDLYLGIDSITNLPRYYRQIEVRMSVNEFKREHERI